MEDFYFLDPDAKLVTILPTWSVTMIKGEEMRRPVRVSYSRTNVCARRDGRDRCDQSGHYYSVHPPEAEGEMKLCPRHWYEIHYVWDRISMLLDMTDIEYAEEMGKLVRSHPESRL